MVLPAVIPRSSAYLAKTLTRLSFAPEIQLDLVDGEFASPASWPYEPRGTTAEVTTAIAPFSIELDLMVQEPLAVAQAWNALGVSRFVFHLESVPNLSALTSFKHDTGAVLGACIDDDAPLETLTEHLSHFDFVQVMGINKIGAQGQQFEEHALDRIRMLRNSYPELMISVDGAVSEATLPRLKEAGANRFVVGSAILAADDPEAMYRKLCSLAS